MINPAQELPAVPQIAPIEMGSSSYIQVIVRLIAMELYKLRRRLMSKVLSMVGIGVVVLFVLILGLGTWYELSRPLDSFIPLQCSTARKIDGCITHPATQADMQQRKNFQINRFSSDLRLPGSLDFFGGISVALLNVLIIILTGTMVGGEYSLGTVRLMFTRGPTRLQFLLAKICTAIVCLVPAFLILIAVGIGLGYTFNPISGASPSFSFFTGVWSGHAILLLLIGLLAWFVYSMLALFFGTSGRSTVAGIVGPLIWIALEPVLTNIISVLSANTTGPLSDVAKAIPDYFIGNNISSLVANQGHILFGADPGTIPDVHSLLVIAVYIVAFIGFASWFTVRRDVTN